MSTAALAAVALAAADSQPVDGIRLLIPATADIVGSLVVVLIIAVPFWKYVLPTFQKVFDERAEKIEGGLAKAELAQAEAAATLADYQQHLAEARADLSTWLAKWSGKYPRLTGWVEETIEQTLTFFRLPRTHHKHLKSTNMLERLNEEIRRRTHVVRIFPNTGSCLRLVRALAVETHENWMEANRYINMDDLREHKKIALRQAA